MKAKHKASELEQVFYYITGNCNAHCIMCYLGEKYRNYGDLPLDTIIDDLARYKKMGAQKLTLLGGEPTMHKKIEEIIIEAKRIGFNYIRITTNGMFDTALLSSESFKFVDTLAFSIDGATNELNSLIRPNTNLDHILCNLCAAKKMGFDVRVNSTVTRQNIDSLIDLIKLVADAGTRQVNLNIVFLEGNAKGKNDIGISNQEWLEVYNELKKLGESIDIELKVPIGFNNIEEINAVDIPELNNKIMRRIYCLPDRSEYRCLLFINGNNIHKGVLPCQSLSFPYCKKLLCGQDNQPLCLDCKRIFGKKFERKIY